MVAAIRSLEEALGVEEKAVSDVEEELAKFAVRRLQAVTEIAAGDELVEGRNFDVLRPGSRSAGLHPRYLSAVAGRRATRAIPVGDGITAADVDPPL
jgi:N-acetylneuraminate synthase